MSLDGSFARESVRKCLASQVENEDCSEHLTLFTYSGFEEPNASRTSFGGFRKHRCGMKATPCLLWSNDLTFIFLFFELYKKQKISK